MTLKFFGAGLLAATMFAAAPALASAGATGQSTECADMKGSAASFTREDWVAWTKDSKAKTAKPVRTKATNESVKPTTQELAEQYRKLLREEKAEEDGRHSAPSGGFSSGAHLGNESPTDKGISAGGMEQSKSAERMKPC